MLLSSVMGEAWTVNCFKYLGHSNLLTALTDNFATVTGAHMAALSAKKHFQGSSFQSVQHFSHVPSQCYTGLTNSQQNLYQTTYNTTTTTI